MTIDNEIKLAQQEKKINEAVNDLMNDLKINNDIQLDEAEYLNLKYSEIGEMLREFDYSTILSNIAKNGITTIEEANCLAYGINGDAEKILENKNEFYNAIAKSREVIEESVSQIENNDITAYNNLAKIFISLTEAGKEFMKAYNNGGEHLDNYLAKRSEWLQRKRGMNKTDADRKAELAYERRAHNISVHTGLKDNPDKGSHPFKTQIKKY